MISGCPGSTFSSRIAPGCRRCRSTRRCNFPTADAALAGYTEASRGCKHLCRHCPVVPVYEGQFRVVQPEVVLADIDNQVAAGAEHITFGDPDFFNGPTHAMRIVGALHAKHPSVSYDVTIKVEHLLQHRDLVPRLAATGCAFVTSAVESVDDRVLALLDKGHTRDGLRRGRGALPRGGVTLVPTFVAFHPWLTLEGYCDLLDTIDSSIWSSTWRRSSSRFACSCPKARGCSQLDEMRAHVGGVRSGDAGLRWSHPDPRVDALQREVIALVGARLTADRRTVFDEVSALAHERAGLPPRGRPRPARDRATVPYLNEPW